MLNAKKALRSFSVDDIQKAKDFYGETLGLEGSSEPEGTLALTGAKTLISQTQPLTQPPSLS